MFEFVDPRVGVGEIGVGETGRRFARVLPETDRDVVAGNIDGDRVLVLGSAVDNEP